MKTESATCRVWIAATALQLSLLILPLHAQTATTAAAPSPEPPQWQVTAGGAMKFDSASVHQDRSGKFKPPSFALSADDGWPPRDGNFHADFPLIVYIQFAYKLWLTPEETRPLFASLPKWALSEPYEIRAQTKSKPTKDQVRLMLQSLLADRFGLQVHFDSQVRSVYALTLIKPGKLGPKLTQHTPSCNAAAPTKAVTAESIFPPPCLDQSLMTIPKPNHIKLTGTRNTTLAMIATYLSSIGELDRPVIDQTGLQGRFDFSLEFTPESGMPEPFGSNPETDVPATSFREALQTQLGLKLSAAKAPLALLVIDRVKRPSEE